MSYVGSKFDCAEFLLLFHELSFVLWICFQEVDESDSNATREASQSKKIGSDPFNQNDADPAKSGAMRKYFIITKRVLSHHFIFLWFLFLHS